MEGTSRLVGSSNYRSLLSCVQAAFNLFHFEIEELESALLQNYDHPYCATVEQLAMRLVKGCFDRISVNPENWESFLHKLFEKKIPRGKTEHIGDFTVPFNTLPVRKKVEILLTLCELRLDREEILESIKNIDSDDLRIEAIGTDNEKNVYYYFFGIRLYKENLQTLAELKKQRNVSQKAETPNDHRRKGTRASKRFNGTKTKNAKNESPVVSSAWSIACHTIQDWESLIEKLKTSKLDKQLGHKLEQKYLPEISEIVAKRERLEQKRLLEFLPRRTSSRIEKVRHQREVLQAAAEKEREEKLEEERQRQAFEDENRKKREIEGRAKRVEDRRNAMDERAKRARLRELRYYHSDVNDYDDNSDFSNASRSRSPIFQNGHNEGSGDEESSEDGDADSERHSAGSDADSERHNVDSDADSERHNVDSDMGSERHNAGSDIDSERCSDANSDEEDGSSDNDERNDDDGDMESEGGEEGSSDDEEPDDNRENESSFSQANSSGNNQICDTNVNLGFRNITYARSRDCVQYQNVQPYTSRSFEQVNGAHVEQHPAHKTIRTYSRMDQRIFTINSTNYVRPENPLTRTITVNFINIPPNATIVRPIRFHHSAS